MLFSHQIRSFSFLLKKSTVNISGEIPAYADHGRQRLFVVMGEKVILVMGVCCWDRLLRVQTYPSPNDKIRTTHYEEMGGGNAANAAATMSRLLSATVFLTTIDGEHTHTHNAIVPGDRIRIQLLSKVGDDLVGKQIMDELSKDGVDVSSSELFRVGEPGTTTSITTIIVSERECTRTCLHTPGSCGELTWPDFAPIDMDQLFRNVIHFHTDGRHAEVALALAREARLRGIPVSADVEKDRKSSALDSLLEIANLVVTDERQIEDYLNRLTKEKEATQGRHPLPPVQTLHCGASQQMTESIAAHCAHVMQPSAFFSRWFPPSDNATRMDQREVVITRGDQGAFHIQCESVQVQEEEESESVPAVHEMVVSPVNGDDETNLDSFRVEYRFTDRFTNGRNQRFSATYTIYTVGVLSDVNVVDTTGAGDAFLGSFVLGQRLLRSDRDPKQNLRWSLAFASWVAAQKLRGPGPRSALPKGMDVDRILGTNRETIEQSLQRLIGPYHFPSDNM